MVQDSLVEYVSSQVKLGVTRDAIKASLVGAGWQAADVEDTLKKVEGGKAAAPAASAPAAGFPSTAMSAKPSDQQMIRVSDLISASDAAPSAAPAATKSSMFGSKAPAKPSAPSSSASASASMAMPAKSGFFSGGMLWKIIAVAAVLIFGGLAGYFYMQNSSLSGKVATLGTASDAVTANLASLNSQVGALNASNTALSASVTTLTQKSDELSLELSFYAVPPGGATSSIGPVMVAGTLGGGVKIPYTITTSYGTKIYIQNSKDAKVIAALAAAQAAGTSVQISGTYMQGSQNINVTAVNGTPIAQ